MFIGRKRDYFRVWEQEKWGSRPEMGEKPGLQGVRRMALKGQPNGTMVPFAKS